MPRKGKRSESQKQRRKLEAASDVSSTNSVSGMNDAQPYVLSVRASHCQTDPRYNLYSRGRQCTCNSLIFLAVHQECNELSSSDLDNILQKGDAVYTRVKQTLQSTGQFVHNFLSFDELPSTVEINSELYTIIKHPRRFGFLRDTPALGDYENLANTLQCLRSDVSDALLLSGHSCIAVFRDQSGRFGYFDSHCRTIDGMITDEDTGTALMLTFSSLEDLIERLLLVLQADLILGDQDQFDLLPVSFVNTLMQSCVHTQHCVTSPELERNTQPSVSPENTGLNKNQRLPDISQLQDSVQQLHEEMFSQVSSTKTNLNEQSKKLNKIRKRKAYNIKWRKDLAQKKNANEKKPTLHKVYDYKKSNQYRQIHKEAMKKTYWNNMIYREKHKQAMQHKYRNIDEYREREKARFTSNYRNIAKFRKSKKNYMIQNYRNKQFRERQKSYINEQYRNDEQFRERKKRYINEQYRNDEQFRERKKSYINEQYRNDEQFRERKKSLHK
ncbi:uncharacterized protein LOC122138641 [Cyprinus carpio]|uniref:Uncharacterized protein LOC122138641 n=1 Tax=Cyprinus carpio TaxID=7962 RepID=A0A9R0A7J2_CYPCA|nr:uncharacterized protein LOC122138641 [Cyprinus carpio]XP_042588009.1 uncharacterized protein LOC122138641 [Cyprinus carpio]